MKGLKLDSLSANICCHLIFNEDSQSHSRSVMRSLNALNVYQVNLNSFGVHVQTKKQWHSGKFQ